MIQQNNKSSDARLTQKRLSTTGKAKRFKRPEQKLESGLKILGFVYSGRAGSSPARGTNSHKFNHLHSYLLKLCTEKLSTSYDIIRHLITTTDAFLTPFQSVQFLTSFWSAYLFTSGIQRGTNGISSLSP